MSAYIERIQSDRSIVPSFNTFYEYMRDDYRKELAQRDIKVEKSDYNIDNMLTTMRQYYRGGRYDFLLNSTENIDLLGKRFIVFEIGCCSSCLCYFGLYFSAYCSRSCPTSSWKPSSTRCGG